MPEAIGGFHERARAFVKIQDGCNMHCAYCIIPSVRPTLESKPAAAVEAEVRGLIAAGVQEIVLCGVRLGRYLDPERDAQGHRVDFPALLSRLLALEGDFRIRLSSFEVTDLTGRFLELAAASVPKLAPSFHVPLQSGCEATLKRMERWYSADFYRKRVSELRAALPDAALFADVMAGFPGETLGDHEESLRFIEALRFDGLHVFRFSPRAGTPAARAKGQVGEAELVRRAEELRALDRRLRERFAERLIGRECRVLVERRWPGGAEGVTDHFLRARFSKDPGPGLVDAVLTRRDGIAAAAEA
jgi:threonylcarbamoyladenosine tRNA methylthiotransferase MtaB